MAKKKKYYFSTAYSHYGNDSETISTNDGNARIASFGTMFDHIEDIREVIFKRAKEVAESGCATNTKFKINISVFNLKTKKTVYLDLDSKIYETIAEFSSKENFIENKEIIKTLLNKLGIKN